MKQYATSIPSSPEIMIPFVATDRTESGEDGILVANSVTMLDGQACGKVVVAGSHGGRIAGYLAAAAGARAIILNDAGIGKDNAGIQALADLDVIGMAAATVDRATAPMGNGPAMLRGRISHANESARRTGVSAGQSCEVAARLLQQAPLPHGKPVTPAEGRHDLFADTGGPAVLGCDSFCLVKPSDAGKILVIGSHSALHDGPRSGLPAIMAAFFHDAGCEDAKKEPAGIARLPLLAAHGIAAATVDFRSARIGDACSMYLVGVISHLNEPAKLLGIRRRMPVQLAVHRLLTLARKRRPAASQH